MLANRFKVMNAIVNQIGAEAHARVSAHIRGVTSGKHFSIGTYHVSAVPLAEKYEQYGLINAALGVGKDASGKPTIGDPDWSKLSGRIGSGSKKPDEPVKRADPIVEVKPEPVNAAKVEVVQPPQPATVLPTGDDLVSIIVRAVQPHIKAAAGVDEVAVRAIAKDEVSKLEWPDFEKLINDAVKDGMKNVPPTRIEIVRGGDVRTLTGLVHPQVTQAAVWLSAGVPVWAWSAAGSGKTHSARQIAEALGVEACIVSVDPTLTVSKLLGYRNVMNGDFVEGYIYKVYKSGGLLCLDEIDTGDPGVIASINALLSNGHYLFPNGETVEKHAKFYVMACANTKGTGAVAGYTARNKLDAATLDRFAVIEWKYDDGLESALACGIGAPAAPWKCGTAADQDAQQSYVTWVKQVRAHVGNSVLISPRASINGCKALRAGVPMSEVIEALVFKLVTDDSRKRIIDTCSLPSTNL